MYNLTGQVWGQYELGEFIGGGYAAVYHVLNQEHHPSLALKVLPFTLSSAQQESLFNELALAKSWLFPHLLPLHDYGMAEDKIYLVMPLLRGGNLWGRLTKAGDQPAMTLAEGLTWVQQMGTALMGLHQVDGVHGRLSYTNCLFDGAGQAYLTDAVMRQVWAYADHPIVVRPHSLLPPEVIQGQPASPLSDQYCLAILLYELLTGHQPFEEAFSVGEVLLSVLQKPIPSVQIWQPALPTTLSDALQRALAKNPAERFASITDFVGALS